MCGFLDNRECSYRKRAEPLHFCRNREEPEIELSERCEVRHVLDDGNFVFQKNAVYRPPQVPDIVDVVRVDSDEGHARVCQKACRILGQERMALELFRFVPVPRPSDFPSGAPSPDTLPPSEHYPSTHLSA